MGTGFHYEKIESTLKVDGGDGYPVNSVSILNSPE